MTAINAATRAILNGTKSPVPTTADMKGALGSLYDLLNECGITNGATAFQASKATRGYQKLPSGLIIQWGQDSTTGTGVTNVTFPIGFPTSAVIAVASVIATGAGTYSVNVSGFGPSIFTAVTTQNNAVVATGFAWIAIGY